MGRLVLIAVVWVAAIAIVPSVAHGAARQRVVVPVRAAETVRLRVGVHAPCAAVRVTVAMRGHRTAVLRLGRGARRDATLPGRVRGGRSRLVVRARALGRRRCGVLVRVAKPVLTAAGRRPPAEPGAEPVLAAPVPQPASEPTSAPPVVRAPDPPEARDACGRPVSQTPRVPSPAPAPASGRRIPLGSAVAGWLTGTPAYRSAFVSRFDALTPENELKMDALHPSADRWDFGPADQLLDLAAGSGKGVRGHTLVWFEQIPHWVEDRAWTRDELRAYLRDYITTVVCRYAGRIGAWDVVNEVMDQSGELRDSLWLRVIGPSYVADAFRWAHAADPSAALYLNDFYTEYGGPKAAGELDLLRGLIADGVPVTGVGMQLHSDSAGHAPSQGQVAGAMAAYADLGLDVAVTEMDVSAAYTPGSPQERDAAGATVFADAARACSRQPRCRSFGVWGVDDGHSWVGANNRPLLLDADYQPKPAYWAVDGLLRGR